MAFLYIILTIIICGAIAFILFKSRAQLAEAKEKMLQQNIQDLQLEKQQLLSELKNIQASNYQLQSGLQVATEKLLSQKTEMNSIGEKFHAEFKNLAQAILEEKTARFTQVNEIQMKAILDPFKADLGVLKHKVEETYDKESKERFSLSREVQRLVDMTQRVSQEANNLTSALKGSNKMQGGWGEMILESILETSGLTKGREYFLQDFIKDADGKILKDEYGKGLQPDVMISLPGNRRIIVDSKCSLIAWDQYIAAETSVGQKDILNTHVKSIRTHIDVLSKKNYTAYSGAMEHALLFIPIEPAFLEALKFDSLLWKYAYDKRILLVSPTNLLVVLKMVADLWKTDQQNRHAIEIAEKAGALYDKFVSFVINLELVGKKIGEAESAYNDAFKQLSSGRGNLVNRVEELKKIGANASKQLPDRMISREAED